MAEIDPTPSDALIPPEAGELLRVTYWHDTNEIDIVPETTITNYPDFPNDTCDLMPPGLEVYADPTPAMTRRVFEDYRALYTAAGPGTFGTMELGRLVELPYITVWERVQRVRRLLPDKLLAVDMEQRIIRRRSVTLGRVILGEETRPISDEEHEARDNFRRDLSEVQQQAYERRIMYKVKPRLMALQERDPEKRQLPAFNHAVIAVAGSRMKINLTNREGRLALRYIEALNQTETRTPGDTYVMFKERLRKQVWDHMSIRERLDYATDLRQLCDPLAGVLQGAIAHIQEYFQALMIGGRPYVEDQGSSLLVMHLPMRVAYATHPPVEGNNFLVLSPPPFPMQITAALPQDHITVPEYTRSNEVRRNGGKQS